MAGIYDLSTTASSNTSIGGASAAEGMSPAGVNDVIRALAAVVKAYQEDVGGAPSAVATGNAYAVTTSSVVPNYAAGLAFIVVPDTANTGAATINFDTVGSKKIRKFSAGAEAALVANDLLANNPALLVYNTAADSGSGAFILLNPGTTITELVNDLSPQLGADLDANAFDIQFDDGTGIRDDSDNETLLFGKVASAVNYLKASNAATGAGPTVAALGDDTDIDLNLSSKGAGNLVLTPGATGEVQIGGERVAVESDIVSGAPRFVLEDQKTQNTAGGTATAGSWEARDLNTEVFDPDGLVSISSNQFTLGAGTYVIYFSAPGYKVTRHRARLWSVSDSTSVGLGSSALAATAGESTTESAGYTRFTIASSKTFRIEQRVESTSASNGRGLPSNFETEVYTRVVGWKE